MIPKSGSQFSDKMMRHQMVINIAKVGRLSEKIMRRQKIH